MLPGPARVGHPSFGILSGVNETGSRSTADVVVVGGGIIGCSAAAIMADRGARVIVVEGRAIGAGASGRNLGAIQHPFDPVLATLYVESLDRYRALADGPSAGAFALGRQPAGLLQLNRDPDAARRQADRMADAFPELQPTFLGPAEVAELEPLLVEGLAAVLLATGYPVPPAAATEAWADLAAERGTRFMIGEAAQVDVADGRATGVRLEGGDTISAGAVLVAAGPWTPRIVDPAGAWRPIVPTWGVTVQVELAGSAPTHVIEEDEGDAINRPAAATERAASGEQADPPSLFSVASAAGITTIGSTFLPAEPDEARVADFLMSRALSYMPSVADARIVGRRTCARPQSVDGRPFIGSVPGSPGGLYVCAGHGPWGISTGPASAAMAARAVLDGTPPPPELNARRSIGG